MELELGSFPTTAFDDLRLLGMADCTVIATVNVPGPALILEYEVRPGKRYWFGVDQLRAILTAYDKEFPVLDGFTADDAAEDPDLEKHMGHAPVDETAARYASLHPVPEWLPRLNADMRRIEAGRHPDAPRDFDAEEAVLETATEIAASYLHDRDGTIEHLTNVAKDKIARIARQDDLIAELRRDLGAGKGTNAALEGRLIEEKAKVAARDRENAELRASLEAQAITDLWAETSALRVAGTQAEETIAQLRAELAKAHQYIGAQAMAALGIEAPVASELSRQSAALEDALSVAIGQLMHRDGLPDLRWYAAFPGFPRERAVSARDLLFWGRAETVEEAARWAEALALTASEDPDPGQVQWTGQVDGRSIEVWAIVDVDAFERGSGRG